MKTCPVCKIPKDVAEFHKNRHHKDGCAYACKSCTSEKKKKSWRENPEAGRIRNRRFWYGIEDTEYQAALQAQDGKCAICHKPFYVGPPLVGKRGDQPHIDHCHETGTFRGLLCGPCNIGIGNLQDSIELLHSAASYLQNFSSKTE